jgi:hypothetical protein
MAVLSINSPVVAQSAPPNRPATAPLKTPPPETATTSLTTPPNLDRPTEVSLGFYLINLGRINQSDETFDVSGYLSAIWKDPRLAFDPKAVGDPEIHYAPEKLWDPVLTIVNSQSAAKKGISDITVTPDGTVKYLEFVHTTVSSDLALKKFPFDSQAAKVVLESLSFDDRRVVFKTDPKMTGYSQDSFVNLSEWKILGIEDRVTDNRFDLEDRTYSRYTFELKLKRNHQFYILKIFIPLLLITLMSWASFWIDTNTAFVSQMNLGITSTLTAITFNFTIANALPRLSYMTLLDAYIFICYIFFFLLIVANVTVHFLLIHSENSHFTNRLRHALRWIFPTAFILCQSIVMTVFFRS